MISVSVHHMSMSVDSFRYTCSDVLGVGRHYIGRIQVMIQWLENEGKRIVSIKLAAKIYKKMKKVV